jgi:putative acetyltransferase
MVIIRPEQAKDIDAVRRINQRAFETATEARLVDLLRERGKLVVSLVAETGDDLLGNIAFTLVNFPSHPECRGVVLGPMAVLSTMQRQGIGSALVRGGVERCRDIGYEFVVVVGHPKYYPRFGFVPPDRLGLRCSGPSLRRRVHGSGASARGSHRARWTGDV